MIANADTVELLINGAELFSSHHRGSHVDVRIVGIEYTPVNDSFVTGLKD